MRRSRPGGPALNSSARSKIVLDYLPLVGYLVSGICSQAKHLSRDYLASAGVVALSTAAGSHRSESGMSFTAFARERILVAVTEAMRSSHLVRRHVLHSAEETPSTHDVLTAALRRPPSTDEIAASLGVAREVLAGRLGASEGMALSTDGTTAQHPVANVHIPEATALVKEQLTNLRTVIDEIPESMRFIIEKIYLEDQHMQDVATQLGTTAAVVSQKRIEALRLIGDRMAIRRDGMSTAHVTPKPRIDSARRAAHLSGLAQHLLLASSRPVSTAIG
jgi:RNA polymerase sigma factor for flagellar operon FliA